MTGKVIGSINSHIRSVQLKSDMRNKYEKVYMHLFAVINQLANDSNLLIQSTLRFY